MLAARKSESNGELRPVLQDLQGAVLERTLAPSRRSAKSPRTPSLSRAWILAVVCGLVLAFAPQLGAQTVTATIPVGNVPQAVALNPVTNKIYVANFVSNTVTVIDGATNTVTATIPVGTSPSGVAVESQTNFIYVANAASGNITVINGMTNATATLSGPSAKNPVAVAANSVTNKIYVANSGSNNVTVIDGAHD